MPVSCTGGTPGWVSPAVTEASSRIRRLFFRVIRNVIGEGHNQLVDDMFTSHDGKYLYVSRPSFADVVGIDTLTGDIVWRTKIEGQRADHSAISPDGNIFLVSASTAGKVHAIDTSTGEIVGEFESGDQPHENTYSKDGERIYHASIGKVYVPTTSGLFDWIKGDRYFQIVDAETYEVIRRVDMREKVKEAGFDAVEVLSGTGYLISEFLSPLTNQRTDEYGGSYENRMRFGLSIIDFMTGI